MRMLIAIVCLHSLLLTTAEVSAQSHQTLKPASATQPRYSPSSSLSQAPEPEDGVVRNELYRNDYFRLQFPLLPDWQEDMSGPVPSNTGYYALTSLRTKGAVRGTVLIDAQDMFFAPYPIQDASDFAQRKEYQAAAYFQDVIDNPSRPVNIAGHEFVRFDFSGAGYQRAAFSTIVRCHVVTIEISSRFPEVFKQLDSNVSRISLLSGDAASRKNFSPICVKDYASEQTVLHKVSPPMVGPRFSRVPARFLIDRKGRVKHIHVINALPVQAKSVEDALAQWLFKPYLLNGRAVELETGILF